MELGPLRKTMEIATASWDEFEQMLLELGPLRKTMEAATDGWDEFECGQRHIIHFKVFPLVA